MKITKIVMIIVMLISLVQLVSAAGIGVAPSELKFENALKGSSYEKEIKIDNTGEKEIIAEIEIINHKEWFTLEESVKVPAKGSAKVKVTIDIPEDTENGEYETMVYVKGKPADVTEGMGLIPGAGFKIKITVTDKEIIEGYVDNILTRDTTLNKDVKFIIGFLNKGNVPINPNAKITIKTEDDKTITNFETQFESVKSGESKSLTTEYNTKGMAVGKYKADVSVYLNNELLKEKTVYFKVLSGQEETKREVIVVKDQPEEHQKDTITGAAIAKGQPVSIIILWVVAGIFILGIGMGLGVGIANVFFKKK